MPGEAEIESISFWKASVLGVVEGLTEFLPVSSTGHLILSAEWMNLDLTHRGVQAFLIVIQAGALLAVIGLYWPSILMMLRGIGGRSPEGLHLLKLLLIAFIPAGFCGFLLSGAISERLFSRVPVALALGLGGVAMIVIDRLHPQPTDTSRPAWTTITWQMALIIGFAQCLALWPGTSRSMVTILAAILVGMTRKSAAEFSFLLALPTLGAATIYDLLKEGPAILDATGPSGLAAGFIFSCIVAALAMKYFLQYLTRHGLGLFGWYRIVVAVLVLLIW